MSATAAAHVAAVARRSPAVGALALEPRGEHDTRPELGRAGDHHIIAAPVTGMALGLSEIADRLDLTIKLLRTPAEESGGGKKLLLERRVCEDVAMAVHSASGKARACSLESGRTRLGVVAHSSAAPTVVPANTSMPCYPRVVDVESRQQLEIRVRSCFEVGAVTTGYTHEVTQVEPGSDGSDVIHLAIKIAL